MCARAGRTWCPVHPHACGEHVVRCIRTARPDGSSPRLWGTPSTRRFPSPSERFIPTPVGNTQYATLSRTIYTVHPHACGEHRESRRGYHAQRGSSPRLWGTPSAPSPSPLSRRFIPTPVGNTPVMISASIAIAVHPHACGEHALPKRISQEIQGSSPRLWGTRHIRRGYGSRDRFIPTPVGNTHSEARAPPGAAVHPHACGEHSISPASMAVAAGSSPRLWGTHTKSTVESRVLRFIPTPVGNTALLNFTSAGPPVHPHACGEHMS